MGTSCTSLHFRNVAQDQVVDAIKKYLPLHNCFVSPALNGWVTVLDEMCDFGDTPEIVETAETICRTCGCPGIVLGLLDSCFLFYWLFNDDGDLESFSYPDNLERATEDEKKGLGGSPERIARLCRSSVTGEEVRRVLAEKMELRDYNLYALENLLGIPQGNATLSYTHIVESHHLMEGDVEEWEKYVYVFEGIDMPAKTVDFG